jgi:hypothetical protein
VQGVEYSDKECRAELSVLGSMKAHLMMRSSCWR